MYIKSIAYAVAMASVFISAAAQPTPDEASNVGNTVADLLAHAKHHKHHHKVGINPINGLPAKGFTRPHKHHHKHHKHHKDHKAHKHHGGKDGHSHKHHKSHTGDMTYYTPGLGSCGITSGSDEMIVAMAEDLMTPHNGANPNTNPWCGRHINIHANGKSAKAKIVDTCAGCAAGGLDASPALFQKFADLGVGRITGVHWSFA